MSEECHKEEIAQTMLAWCIMQIALIPLIGCLWIFIMWIVATAVMKRNTDTKRAIEDLMEADSEEQQDLVNNEDNL